MEKRGKKILRIEIRQKGDKEIVNYVLPSKRVTEICSINV